MLLGQTLRAETETQDVFGSLEVRLTLANAIRPSPMPVRMDREVCGESRPSSTLRLGAHQELADAVVWVEGARVLGWPKLNLQPKEIDSSKLPTIVMENCEHRPLVVITRPSGGVRFINRDKILHSLRGQGTRNYPVFRPHPPHLKETLMKFEHPEIVPIFSDLHPWMKATVVVAPHQNYAITNTLGRAEIKFIPTGEFQLKVWHSDLGLYEYPQAVPIRDKKVVLEIKLDQKSMVEGASRSDSTR